MAHLQNTKGKPTLPQNESVLNLCNTFNNFFVSKISNIRDQLDNVTVEGRSQSVDNHKTQGKRTTVLPSDNASDQTHNQELSGEMRDPAPSACAFVGERLSSFTPVSVHDMTKIIKQASNASCETDPIPTKLVKGSLLDTLLPVITQIVNLSLNSGNFPELYKRAHVKPLLKKISLNPDVLKNFRPVSNLTFVSKLIEKVVSCQLIAHLHKYDLLEKFQSAYKSCHSTETALLRVSNDILQAIDDKQCVFLTLLDLSAAFDTIDHFTLLSILRDDLGVNGIALDWFTSYLDNRSQCVSIDGVLSEPKTLPHGVPQGSVLGPLLFCAYMTELGRIIRNHGLDFHTYADDTQIYLAFKLIDSETALHKLELCINEIRSWMVKQKLKLNEDKTEFIIISSPHNKKELNGIKIKIGNETVIASHSARNLGVVFDCIFNMESHITSVCQSCYFHLRNIGAIRRYLNNETAAQVIHAFITSKLDYCNSLFYNLPGKSVHRLKKIQNTAVRIITRCNPQDNITPHLKSLHWLPVHLRIEFKILLLTFKVLNGLAPMYLCDLIKFRVTPHSLRSESTNCLDTPRTRTVTYGDRAFAVAAPVLWNSLPEDIRDEAELSTFKTKLKTHLFGKF